MGKTRVLWGPFALALVALVAVACGTSATATPLPTPTAIPVPTPIPVAEISSATNLNPAEVEYLEQLGSAAGLFAGKAEAFREAFARTYALPQPLFDTLKEAGAGTAFIESLEALEQLDPPERFQADHQRVVETYREYVRVDAELGRAIDNEDLVALNLLNSQLGGIGGLNTVEVSGTVCQALAPPDSPSNLCAASEPLPGGEYGVQLNVTLRKFQALFQPLVFPFLGPVLPEDRLTILSVQQPKVVDLVQDTLDKAKGLTPPAEFLADHAALIQYLDRTLGTANGMLSALEAQDMEKFQQEFSTGEGAFCEARQTFSDAFKPLVNAHFSFMAPPEIDDIDICGGGPG